MNLKCVYPIIAPMLTLWWEHGNQKFHFSLTFPTPNITMSLVLTIVVHDVITWHNILVQLKIMCEIMFTHIKPTSKMKLEKNLESEIKSA
jgi:hypothetical protein